MKFCSLHRILVFASLLLLVFGSVGVAQDDSAFKEIGRTTEKEVSVVISSSFGSLTLSKGETEKIFIGENLSRRSTRFGMNVDYVIRNRTGYLDISTTGNDDGENSDRKGSVKIGPLDGGKWSFRFSDLIPIALDINIGVGKGDLDLTGLQIKDLNLSAGAADVRLVFNQLNKATIDEVNIETGVSKFAGVNLGYANFRYMRFQGGVGSYSLDFGGDITREVDVDIEVGLGVVTVLVPETVGARVFHDKSWLSRLQCDRDFQSVGDGEYRTANYNSSEGKMNIRINSGLGSVRIRRR